MTRSEDSAEPVHGVVIGHGDLPRALADAAMSIVGKFGGITAISNMELPTSDLAGRLAQVVDEHGGRAIVFVDMFGSSCSNAGSQVKRNHPGVAVICGVNLPMLIRFLSYRERLGFDELVRLMEETGQSAVKPVET